MLKKSVPPFVAQMREMAELFGAEQPELDRLEGILTELLAQFYIKTATYSLNQWEQDFGIAENPELTQEQRRAQVLAKLNMADARHGKNARKSGTPDSGCRKRLDRGASGGICIYGVCAGG